MKQLVLLFLFVGNIAYSEVKNNACPPILLLNGYKNGDTVAKKDLALLKSLSMYFPCTKAVSNQVISYEFTLLGGQGVSHHGFDNALTSRSKETLAKAQAGNKIFIDNVLVKNTDGSIGHIAGITLLIGGQSSIPVQIDTGANIPSCAPVLLIGKHKNGASITKNELNLVDQLKAYSSCNTGKKYNGCSTDITYKIVSYKLSATINEKLWSLKLHSPEIPKEVKMAFRDIKGPTTLFISDIQAKYADGCILEIPGIVLNINPVSKQKGGDFTRSKKSSVIKK